MERKVLGSAECSSHASPFRIPRRSRCDLRECFLLALGAGLAHCACPVRRAAPPLGSWGSASAPGFTRSRAGGDGRSLGPGWLAGGWRFWPRASEAPRPALCRPARSQPGSTLRAAEAEGCLAVAWGGAHGGMSPGRVAAQQVVERRPPQAAAPPKRIRCGSGARGLPLERGRNVDCGSTRGTCRARE